MYAWQFLASLCISEREGWEKFVSVQNHYNLVYREDEREMIPLCQSERISIIPWGPLARASWEITGEFQRVRPNR